MKRILLGGIFAGLAAKASFGQRVALVTLLGVFAWLSISVSYWNWYHFPGAYIAGEAIDQVGGWLFGGIVLAAVYRGR
jgi:hypothetical protein